MPKAASFSVVWPAPIQPHRKYLPLLPLFLLLGLFFFFLGLLLMRPWWKLLTGQGSMEQCGRVIVHTAVPLPFLLTPSHPLLLSAILNKQLNIAGETVHIHRVTIFPDMHAWCKCVKPDLFSWPSVCHRQGLHGKENAMGSQLQNSFAKCQQTSTVQFYR